MKAVISENSYNDTNERSATNRTPLLEHYQNHSLPRNTGSTIGSTSVPRATIASGIKLLKESSTSPIDQSYQQQFLHSNNLKNYVWNKGGIAEQADEDGQNAQGQNNQNSNRGGSRIKKADNAPAAGGGDMRPSTRNNQRRPVSRQVNAIDNSGVSAQKLIVQQQMRNTHFGDGFGFNGKFKGELSLDSERKLSRKRGTKAHVNGSNIHAEDQGLRESTQGTTGIRPAANKDSKFTAVGKDLNRSITINQTQASQQQHNNIGNNQIANQVQTNNNNDQVSTQESSGTHFYQANSFLNKSIESNSSRSIMIGAQQHLQTMIDQQTQQQISNTIVGGSDIQSSQYINSMKTSQKIQSKTNNVKSHFNQHNQNINMGGTSYENNAFKNISRNNSQNQRFPNNSTGLAREQSQSPPLKPIDEVVTRINNTKNGGITAINQNSTQSKFYNNNNQSIPSNKDNIVNTSQNKIMRKKTRNPINITNTNNLANLCSNQTDNGLSQAQDSTYQQMKSYNVTQEKFYPSKSNQYQSNINNSNNTNSYHQTSIEKRPQKMSTFYITKQANSSLSNPTEVKMSLEFINQNSQQVTKKKQGGAQYIKEKTSEMIREEQYDEDQDENSDNEYKQKHQYINSNGGDDKFGKTNTNQEENCSIDSLQTPANALQSNYGGERPTNRLGCSRAFHQTKGDWKQGSGGQSSEYSNSNAHSLPRNNLQSLQGDNDHTSCKTTSSAASLIMIQKPQNGNIQSSNNNSSISPKPHKWAAQNSKESYVSGANNITVNSQNINIGGVSAFNTSVAMQNASQKISEMQKEVNFMYQGGISNPKKKVGAGIKLNPITRASNAMGCEQTYQL